MLRPLVGLKDKDKVMDREHSLSHSIDPPMTINEITAMSVATFARPLELRRPLGIVLTKAYKRG
jgi:hypothetical protein